MHGDQHVATLFLTAFSIGIGIGSILAARLVAGRIILVLGPIGCFLMALVGLDIAWVAGHAAPAATPLTFSEFLASVQGARMTVDLVLLAVAAGLFIVPVFAAVQAWARADQRARVIAGVNVLSALFMTAGAGVLGDPPEPSSLDARAPCRHCRAEPRSRASLFAKILPMSPLRDFILLVYRLLFRLEVKGIETLDKAGAQRIIAVNHASFLDAGLMLALLDKDPVFAIDHIDRPSLVGEAVPALVPGLPARPDQAARRRAG